MNFIKKILDYIKNIFKKDHLIMHPEVEEPKEIKEEKNNVIKPNIFDIELLQRKYENNIISLENLSNEELEMLNDLYSTQIAKLDIIKEDKERQIRELDEKISKIKNAV